MRSDLTAHNRVARLAVDQTPADFACLVTYDAYHDAASIESVSGTHTRLFSQVNTSARRTQPGWNPSIIALIPKNDALKKIFPEKQTVGSKVQEFLPGVIEAPLIDSTFAQFNNHWCLAIPVIIDSNVYAAVVFVSPNQFTNSEEGVCREFVDKCRDSVSSLLEEQRLDEEIERLTEQRRLTQKRDPLGLTQRSRDDSASPRTVNDIRLSLDTQTATRGGRELKLTRRELDLLDTFLQSPGTALSRVQIVSRVWVERNGISSNVLNVTVKNLREKLEAQGEPRVIHSLRAYGYVLKN